MFKRPFSNVRVILKPRLRWCLSTSHRAQNVSTRKLSTSNYPYSSSKHKTGEHDPHDVTYTNHYYFPPNNFHSQRKKCAHNAGKNASHSIDLFETTCFELHPLRKCTLHIVSTKANKDDMEICGEIRKISEPSACSFSVTALT